MWKDANGFPPKDLAREAGDFFAGKGRCARPDLSSEFALHIHTHVREDAIQLFGFATEVERQLFLLLMGVTGIGPRLALTILSGLPPESLAGALAAGDLRRRRRSPASAKKPRRGWSSS